MPAGNQSVMASRQAMKLGFGQVIHAQQGSELPQHGGEGGQVGKSWEKAVGKVQGTLGDVRPLDGGGQCLWLAAYFGSCSVQGQSRKNQRVVGLTQGPVGTPGVSAKSPPGSSVQHSLLACGHTTPSSGHCDL